MRIDKKTIGVLTAIIIYVSIFGYFYASLSGELGRKASEYKTLQAHLKEARLRVQLIHRLKALGVDSEFADRILSKTDLPMILDTFMRTGKSCGVSIPAITPREAEAVPGLNDVVKIPVAIEAESHCRNLGEFLSVLIKDLRSAMIQVDSLQIKKAESGSGARLKSVIEMSMYARKE